MATAHLLSSCFLSLASENSVSQPKEFVPHYFCKRQNMVVAGYHL